MSERVLILHIGPHKTGSTSLQNRLLNSRAHLNSNGFEYPLFGITHFAHHDIYRFLAPHHEASSDMSELGLKALTESGSNIILSSEDFIYLPVESLQRLRQLFEGFRIEVVLFLRNPVDLWPSHWQEMVKNGRDEPLIDYIGAYFGVTDTIDFRYMHPVSQATRFAKVFGRENLRLFCYDNILAENDDLIGFFVRNILQIPALPSDKTLLINRSLRPDTIELLRCLNERFRFKTGVSPKARILSAFLKVQRTLEQYDDYKAFSDAAEAHACTITLDGSSEFFRNRERLVMNRFGDRIENAFAPDRVFVQERRRTYRYGVRYWIDRFGYNNFIDGTLATLSLGQSE
jgi:hypothetical protein